MKKRTNLYEIKCIVCEIKFKTDHYQFINGRKYCSNNCSQNDPNKIIERCKGINHHNWKNGTKLKKMRNGGTYILILSPTHPFCDSQGYVREHRLVVESRIGRYLTRTENVHHINEIGNDNRPENLIAFINNSAHKRFHSNPLSVNPEEIVFDGRLL